MNIANLLGDSAGEHSTFVYVVAVIAALNGLLFGFDIGVIAGALLYIDQTFSLSPFLKGIVTTSVLVGAMIGAATGGRLADRFGRRLTTLGGAVAFFIGALGMAVSPTVEWLIVWRVFAGIAVGIASIVGPLLIAETAPEDIRGSLGFLQQLMITIGILLAYLVNYTVASLITGTAAWRWMLGFGMVPAAVLAIGTYFLPESPRWFVENGRVEQARNVLSRIRTGGDIDEEIENIREVSEIEGKGGLSDLLEPWVRPALIVGVGLAIIQQFSGINTIIYYAPILLSNAGFGNLSSLLATVGIGIVNVGMTVVAILLVDRVGRRPLLLVGTAGLTVMLAIIGAAFFFATISGGFIGYVVIACIFLYITFYAISLGPVFWLLISEIYPLRIRGTAEGTASVANWGANLIVGLAFLPLIQLIGEGLTFWIFGVFSIIAFWFIYTRVPETMGRSLEDIEADLQESTVVGADDANTPDRNPSE